MKFELTDYEKKKAKKWIKKHSKDHPMKNIGAIGGRWSYIFTPTSIGVLVNIECGVCKKNENISDYDSF